MVVVPVIPIGDFAPRRHPDALVPGNVFERLREGFDPVRLADRVGVKRDAHHHARVRPLLVKPVEVGLQHLRIAPRRLALDVVDDDVVHFERVGNADEAALLDLHRLRLVVAKQVASVLDAVFSQQVHGALRVGERRRQPAGNFLAGVFFHGLEGILDDGALLRLVHLIAVPGVVDAVGEELPVPLLTLLDDLGVVFAHGHVQRHRAAHTAAVHGLHHAPVPGAVAVVALSIGNHVRRRPGPCLA
jgi:hypothetical protein